VRSTGRTGTHGATDLPCPMHSSSPDRCTHLQCAQTTSVRRPVEAAAGLASHLSCLRLGSLDNEGLCEKMKRLNVE
jgi:hypothetical protein